jgi:orotate phosphoribosyltransferase
MKARNKPSETRTDLIFPLPNEEPLALLTRCGGYYDCPIGPDQEPKGPLVGYTARYDGTHQWVGFTYANFAKAEEYPPVVRYFGLILLDKLTDRGEIDIDVYCGVPEGGKALAYDLASFCGRRYIYAEKEVLAVKTADLREQSRLVFGRHRPRQGDRVALIEDVTNNFDSTGQLVAAVEQAGATVTVIACFLNRSYKYDKEYAGYNRRIPIVSVVRKPIREYKQDDPMVAKQVQNHNVAYKPKDELDRLMAAMEIIEKREQPPTCPACGHKTVRNGACFKCMNCGTTVGGS